MAAAMHHLNHYRPLCAQAQRSFHRALSGRCINTVASRTATVPRPSRSHLTASSSLSASSWQHHRLFHASSAPQNPPSSPPKSKDRGPPSKEDTQTDFSAMNVLGNVPPPTTGVDTCMEDGFALNSGLRITGAGVLLFGGEAFQWRPWLSSSSASESSSSSSSEDKRIMRNAKGQWEVDFLAWGVLDLAWPKPDLLVLGTGKSIHPLSPATRKHINDLGIRIEILDTRNAAAQFNLLATERGTQQVAAALVPIGWRG